MSGDILSLIVFLVGCAYFMGYSMGQEKERHARRIRDLLWKEEHEGLNIHEEAELRHLTGSKPAKRYE